MSIKLFEIETMLREAVYEAEKEIEETGDVSEDWANFLNDIELEKEKKVISVAVVIKEFLAEQKVIEEERKKLQAREAVLKNKAERLKNYLASNLSSGEKFDDPRAKINWRKSSSVVIVDEDRIPPQLCRIQKTPIKEEIKKFLSDGKEKGLNYDWAVLKENLNLQIK